MQFVGIQTVKNVKMTILAVANVKSIMNHYCSKTNDFVQKLKLV